MEMMMMMVKLKMRRRKGIKMNIEVVKIKVFADLLHFQESGFSVFYLIPNSFYHFFYLKKGHHAYIF